MPDLPERVGLNALFLRPEMGGLETYVRELVPALMRLAPAIRFSVYTSAAGARHLRSTVPWVSEVDLVSHPLLGLPGLKAVTELSILGWMAGRQVELLHSVAMTAPLRTRAANVVVVPDVIWRHGDRPDLTTRLWRATVPTVARRADRVIAISQTAAQEIVRELDVDPERIDVTPLGHSPQRLAPPLPAETVRERFGLGSGPVVLHVGTRKPHKNVLGLIAAMPAVLAAHPSARLVLAGNSTQHESELIARTAALGVEPHVTFLPFVEAAELEGLYEAAACVVLPSFHEGFGLPVLEAMGRGVPVACSNVSALAEVAGDAAMLFDPHRHTDIAAAVTALLGNPSLRAQMTERGRARGQTYTWTVTAEATLSSYARAWRARSARGPDRPARGPQRGSSRRFRQA